MISSPALQHLCCEIIEEYYGNFFRTIFGCLCQDGRVKATQVAQKCHLPLRQVHVGLASLVQLKLVNHHSTGDLPATYSPNLHNAYDIIRFGKLIQTAFVRHGRLAAAIVEVLAQLGFATVGEVRDRILSDGGGLEAKSPHLIQDCVEELLEDEFIMHLRSAHFKDPYDAQRDVEFASTSLATLARLSGTKAKQEHAARVTADYEKVVSIKGKETGYVNQAFLSNGKQQSNGSNSITSSGYRKDLSTILIQINPRKLVSIVQGQRIVAMASKCYDEQTKIVMRCLIEQMSSSDPWNKDSLDEPFLVNVKSFTNTINSDKSTNVSAADANKPTTNGYTQNSNSDHIRVGEVQRCITTLAEGPFRTFLHAGGLESEWFVDRKEFEAFLQREETLKIMNTRLEDPGPRILRILVDKGKLEEKTLQEIALLGAKELRQCLSLLKQIGCLDLQEVPRNQQRQPNHTVFLWFYDNKRTSALVLESIYATIERLILFLKDERHNIASTLTKFTGRDLAKPVESGLEEVEYNLYMRYRRLEGWIWAEISRLDSTVAILRNSRTHES